MKNFISMITSIALCGAFITTAFAESAIQRENSADKFSECLLAEYGVSRESIRTLNGKLRTFQEEKKIPVLVWCDNDINHQTVLSEALSIITDDLSEKLRDFKFCVTEKTTVYDILELGIEPSADAIQKYIEKEREISREMYSELNQEFIKAHMSDSEILYVSLYSPVIVTKVSLSEALHLADDENILELAYYGSDLENLNELNVSKLAIEAQRTYNTYGYTGLGVKIGQFESNVPDVSDNTQLIPAANRIHINPTSVNSTTSVVSMFAIRHANAVADIMIGQQTVNYPAGIAPNAELYCTSNKVNNEYLDQLSGIEWLLTNGVNVINASVEFGSDGRNTYGSYSKWLDHIAKNHYVTFVKSAGNDPQNFPTEMNAGISSGGMAYNIISVGNINDKNTLNLNDDELSETSCYYDAETNLAYKPDLCAPGTGISCSAYEQEPMASMNGTSAAAPHVTGTVALMFEAKPFLKLFPEVVKAILTATVNPNSPHRYCVNSWTTNSNIDSYAKYGSGLLDTYYAVNAARNTDFHYGRVASSLNQVVRTMHVSTSNTRVRVSLAFNVNNTAISSHSGLYNINHDNLQNLKLTVTAPNGSNIWTSDVNYNNVENIEFIAPQSGDYRVKVTKTVNSYAEDVEYGVAWMEVD